MKFKIEKYVEVCKRRSWMACQENNSDAYYDVPEDRFRIVDSLGRIVKKGFSSEYTCQDYIEEKLDISSVKAFYKWEEHQLKEGFLQALKSLQKQKKESSKYLTKIHSKKVVI